MANNFHLLYVDPGTGSFIAQIIIASIVGILFFFRTLIFKTRLFLGATLSKSWLHPVLVGFFFILFKIKSEFILFNGFEVLQYLFLISFASLIIYFILSLLIKDSAKAGIITSLFALIFLFYEPLYELIKALPVIQNHSGFILLFLFLLICFFILRTKNKLTALTSYLNVVFVCLFLYEAGFTIVNYFKYSSLDNYIEKNDFEKSAAPVPNLPNIYYIVFDSYTSSASLKKYFGYENEIDSFLLSKGFYCARNAKSEFHETQKSISSTFNMAKGDNLDSVFQDEILSTAIYSRNIQCSKVVKELVKQHYKIINLSFFDLGDAKHLYDNSWLPSPNYLGTFLFCNSRLASFYVNAPEHIYQTDNEIVDSVQKIALQKQNDKFFVYAHLSITHGPYYFDRNGKIFPEGNGPFPSDEKKNYLESVMYANNCLKKMVNEITSSKTPSVIILQGDHGSRIFQKENENDQEQNTAFSAYYFPDGDYARLNDSISPVNSFKVVLAKYFHFR